jgi:threonine aldolase
VSDGIVRGFASDNAAGIHPAVLQALADANCGHAPGYGHDERTHGVEELFTAHFGEGARAFMVFNGTAANVLSLRAACRRWEAAICAETAHLNVDECGAPESIAGVKLLTVKIEHAVQPRLVSISQCTELGTSYSQAEIRALAEHAHAHGLILHMDGARLSNAAAALEFSLGELSIGLGVDILSFGGTKNGLLGVEAVVFRTPELAVGFEYVRKQSLQLASKMRFLAVQFGALLTDELWLHNARQANAMAARLAEAVRGVPGLTITRPVQTNVVFATLPAAATSALQERFAFYVWDERIGEVRWMCSWDTTEQDVDAFAEAVRAVLG